MSSDRTPHARHNHNIVKSHPAPDCTCEKTLPKIYSITCPNFDTAQWVYNKRFESIYPLLKKGEVLEVKGNEFQIKSYPKP